MKLILALAICIFLSLAALPQLDLSKATSKEKRDIATALKFNYQMQLMGFDKELEDKNTFGKIHVSSTKVIIPSDDPTKVDYKKINQLFATAISGAGYKISAASQDKAEMYANAIILEQQIIGEGTIALDKFTDLFNRRFYIKPVIEGSIGGGYNISVSIYDMAILIKSGALNNLIKKNAKDEFYIPSKVITLEFFVKPVAGVTSYEKEIASASKLMALYAAEIVHEYKKNGFTLNENDVAIIKQELGKRQVEFDKSIATFKALLKDLPEIVYTEEQEYKLSSQDPFDNLSEMKRQAWDLAASNVNSTGRIYYTKTNNIIIALQKQYNEEVKAQKEAAENPQLPPLPKDNPKDDIKETEQLDDVLIPPLEPTGNISQAVMDDFFAKEAKKLIDGQEEAIIRAEKTPIKIANLEAKKESRKPEKKIDINTLPLKVSELDAATKAEIEKQAIEEKMTPQELLDLLHSLNKKAEEQKNKAEPKKDLESYKLDNGGEAFGNLILDEQIEKTDIRAKTIYVTDNFGIKIILPDVQPKIFRVVKGNVQYFKEHLETMAAQQTTIIGGSMSFPGQQNVERTTINLKFGSGGLGIATCSYLDSRMQKQNNLFKDLPQKPAGGSINFDAEAKVNTQNKFQYSLVVDKNNFYRIKLKLHGGLGKIYVAMGTSGDAQEKTRENIYRPFSIPFTINGTITPTQNGTYLLTGSKKGLDDGINPLSKGDGLTIKDTHTITWNIEIEEIKKRAVDKIQTIIVTSAAKKPNTSKVIAPQKKPNTTTKPIKPKTK